MELLDLCARQWSMSVGKSLDGLARLPAAQVHTIRYEDVVANESALEALCDFVGLAQPQRVLTRYRETVRSDDVGKWRSALDDTQQRRLTEALGPLLTRLGYPLDAS